MNMSTKLNQCYTNGHQDNYLQENSWLWALCGSVVHNVQHRGTAVAVVGSAGAARGRVGAGHSGEPPTRTPPLIIAPTLRLIVITLGR